MNGIGQNTFVSHHEVFLMTILSGTSSKLAQSVQPGYNIRIGWYNHASDRAIRSVIGRHTEVILLRAIRASPVGIV